jgi:hypothetical protein
MYNGVLPTTTANIDRQITKRRSGLRNLGSTCYANSVVPQALCAGRCTALQLGAPLIVTRVWKQVLQALYSCEAFRATVLGHGHWLELDSDDSESPPVRHDSLSRHAHSNTSCTLVLEICVIRSGPYLVLFHDR